MVLSGAVAPQNVSNTLPPPPHPKTNVQAHQQEGLDTLPLMATRRW